MLGFSRSSDRPGTTRPDATAADTTAADTTAAGTTAADSTEVGPGAAPRYPKARSDAEWRQKLTPQEYQVLRLAGTERAWVGEYTGNKDVGVYSCRACDTELFRSEHKFESNCGWPSFYTALAGDAVEEITDTTMGMRRTEVRCAACGSHLGHVFSGEGFDTPTDLRYCINSISMDFRPA